MKPKSARKTKLPAVGPDVAQDQLRRMTSEQPQPIFLEPYAQGLAKALRLFCRFATRRR